MKCLVLAMSDQPVSVSCKRGGWAAPCRAISNGIDGPDRPAGTLRKYFRPATSCLVVPAVGINVQPASPAALTVATGVQTVRNPTAISTAASRPGLRMRDALRVLPGTDVTVATFQSRSPAPAQRPRPDAARTASRPSGCPLTLRVRNSVPALNATHR